MKFAYSMKFARQIGTGRRSGLLVATALSVATLASHPAAAASYILIAPYAGVGTSTGVNGINDAGYITGVVGNADGSSDGFIRTPDGAYTLFQVAGSNGFDTYGRTINDSNVVTGYSTDFERRLGDRHGIYEELGGRDHGSE